MFKHYNSRNEATPLAEWIKARTTVTESGCMEWTGPKANGYGVLYVDGVSKRVHRLVLELHKGPLTRDISACHYCNNPSCANIAHLYPGSQSENTRQAFHEGRAKMTPEKQRLISERLKRNSRRKKGLEPWFVTQ